MRPRTLLVMFLLVVGLLAFIWFFERDLPSSDERREAEKKVLEVESSEIVELAVTRGDEVVHLRREESDGSAAEGEGETAAGLTEAAPWRLVEPFESRADESEVRSLLDVLAGLESERWLEDFDPQAVGLAEPRAELRWVTAEGEQSLLVGSEVPASGELIVQRVGSPRAAVVPRDLWTRIEKSPGQWRSRQVFTENQTHVIEVKIEHEGRRLELERRAGDFWLVQPVEDRARESRVNDLLSQLLATEAERFVDGPVSLAEIGLDPPYATFEVVPRAGREPQRLELGAPVDATSPAADEAGEEAAAAPLRYARFEGQIVELEDKVSEALAGELSGWQADRWSALDVWQVDRAAVRSEGVETVVERSGGDWKRGEETIGYDEVSDFLYAIDEAASERLVPADVEAWGDPVLELDLAGESVSETLAVYPPRDGVYPATADDRGFALLLESETIDDLLAKLEAVRTAEPKSEAPEEPAAEAS